MLLGVDQDARTVKLIQVFQKAAKTWATYKHNLQAIDPTNAKMNYVIGSGSQPDSAELKSVGTVSLDA